VIFTNGDYFQGMFVEDKKDGEGLLSYFNGDRFKGQWKND
jgi:hypothetical protein